MPDTKQSRKNSKTKTHKTSKTTNTTIHTKKLPIQKGIIEYEGRVLDINRDELVQKIKLLGGTLKKHLLLFKRSVFNLCNSTNGYVRVRDEGDKITMTSKTYANPKYPLENEIILADSFVNGQAFLRSLQLHDKAYHETMRETWTIPKKNNSELCEIALDYIPGLPLYAELECKTERDLHKSIKLLGFNKNELKYGAYGNIFTHYYDISIHNINNVIPSLTFNNIVNELKPYITKNQNLVNEVAKSHLIVYNQLNKKQHH